ncbi:Uncharacterised protein [Mycobacteroides abscessus subsp. massiliense]|nr:Uncharacterised protein [Mycobacteroides abscessus subsp. massiliense]
MPRSELLHSKNYGGARPGSGRKKIGVAKALRITLPTDEWKAIDEMIQAGQFDSRAEYFRFLHQRNWKNYVLEDGADEL